LVQNFFRQLVKRILICDLRVFIHSPSLHLSLPVSPDGLHQISNRPPPTLTVPLAGSPGLLGGLLPPGLPRQALAGSLEVITGVVSQDIGHHIAGVGRAAAAGRAGLG